MDTAERIRSLVAPLVEAPTELYDVEFSGGILRVTVDQPAGGVDIGMIGRLTRAISNLLDEEDPIAGEYTLEVSSPGLERPLRRPEHFTRAVGSTVAVKARAGIDGDRRIKGALVAADADTITIQPEGTGPDEVRTLALTDVEKARTVFEWGPAPKPGHPTTSSSKQKKAARS